MSEKTSIWITILNYLGQASTYKGLFAILGAFGIMLKPECTEAIIACALGIIGVINVFINDKKVA